jgi:hypothetical protein
VSEVVKIVLDKKSPAGDLFFKKTYPLQQQANWGHTMLSSLTLKHDKWQSHPPTSMWSPNTSEADGSHHQHAADVDFRKPSAAAAPSESISETPTLASHSTSDSRRLTKLLTCQLQDPQVCWCRCSLSHLSRPSHLLHLLHPSYLFVHSTANVATVPPVRCDLLQALDMVLDVLGKRCMPPADVMMACISVIDYHCTGRGIGGQMMQILCEALYCIGTATEHYRGTDVCNSARGVLCDMVEARAKVKDTCFGQWVLHFVKVSRRRASSCARACTKLSVCL